VSTPLEDADVETASFEYARRFDSPVGRWMLERQLAVTLDLLRDKKSSTILDVGGGHGQVAPALSRHGHQVTVLASSPAAVSSALRPSLRSGAVRLLVGDLREPPVEARSFDIVLSYRLLAHAYDLPGLITGLTRPAERTVIVDYATTRSFNAASELLFSAKKRVEKNTRPFQVMRDAQVAFLFGEGGCYPVAWHPQFFWPMALHRALGSVPIARALEAPMAALGLRALFGSPVITRFDRV
jgi:SAM-dependent methyltransferase